MSKTGPRSNGTLVKFGIIPGYKFAISPVFADQYLKKYYLLKDKLILFNLIPNFIKTNAIFNTISFAEGVKGTQTKLPNFTSVSLVLRKKACNHRYSDHC